MMKIPIHADAKAKFYTILKVLEMKNVDIWELTLKYINNKLEQRDANTP